MLDIRIPDHEIQTIVELLKKWPNDIPAAIANGLNATGRYVKEEVKKLMPTEIDKPTPYTLNAFQLNIAKRDNLVAWVGYKTYGDGGKHYLEPMALGMSRRLKKIEKRQANNLFMVPSVLKKKDQYGNIAPQTYRKEMQILKNLLSGQKDAQYFYIPKKGLYLRPRRKKVKGRGRTTITGLPRVQWAEKSAPPRYSKAFRFYEHAERLTKQIYIQKIQQAVQDKINFRRSRP